MCCFGNQINKRCKILRRNDDEQNKANDNQDMPPEPKKKNKKKLKIKHMNKWKHSSLPVKDDFEWNISILVLDSHEPLSSLFGKFLTEDILQLICIESVRYAQNKSCMIWKSFLQFFSSLEMLIYLHVLCFRNVQLMFTMILEWCQGTGMMRQWNIFIKPTIHLWIQMTNSAEYDVYLINWMNSVFPITSRSQP